jgi:hypothetical protein
LIIFFTYKDAKYNSLIDKEKALQNARLFFFAPLKGGMLQPFSLVEFARIRKLKD